MFSLLKNSARALNYLHNSFQKSAPIAKYAFSSKKLKNENKSVSMITYKIDPYRSVTIDPESLTDDPVEFEESLLESLDSFRRCKIRGVWLQLDLAKSALIPIALKHGFTFHHAKPDYVLLSQWIPKGELNKLPHYASHYIGVGGIVINDETDEILVIKEKISLVGNLWKIPGGLVDEGEHISEAAEREVFEETGIKAKFHSVLAFREKMKYKWDQPDIYFAVLLKPETLEINIDPVEIQEAKWMKIDEYISINNRIETQNRIADVIKLATLKGSDKIKKLDDETLLNLAGFGAETFTQEIAGVVSSDNMFYCSNVVKKTK